MSYQTTHPNTLKVETTMTGGQLAGEVTAIYPNGTMVKAAFTSQGQGGVNANVGGIDLFIPNPVAIQPPPVVSKDPRGAKLG